MSQPLANVNCAVHMTGLDSSQDKVWKHLYEKPDRVNPRTNQKFTQISPLFAVGPGKKGFTIARHQIKGNWPNDVDELMNHAVSHCNVDVKYEVLDFQRIVVDK